MHNKTKDSAQKPQSAAGLPGEISPESSAPEPLQKAPLRPVEFVADCPACERPLRLDPCEWEEDASGAFAAHGPERYPVCEYCRTQFEIVPVRVLPA